MSNVPSIGALGCWFPPCSLRHVEIMSIWPFCQLHISGHGTLRGPRFPWFNHCYLWLGALVKNCNIRVLCLSLYGHWDHLLLIKFLESSSFVFLCQDRVTVYQPHLTHQIYHQGSCLWPFSLSLSKSKLIQYIANPLHCSLSLQINQADTSTLSFLPARNIRPHPLKFTFPPVMLPIWAIQFISWQKGPR